MQLKRWRGVVLMRRLLTCALCAIATAVLLSVHLHLNLALPYSRVPDLHGRYRLPFTTTQHHDQEQSWTSELVPPRPFSSSRQFGAASGSRNWTTSDFTRLWKRKHPSNHDFLPCVKPTANYSVPGESRGFLLVNTNGGLNQMRVGICDMVAVARIMNATLIVPELDKKSYWEDSSNFSDIFDEDHFINALANDVKVIRKLPKNLSHTTKASRFFRSWSGMDYYQGEIASLYMNYRVIKAAKSDSRLVNNNLPPDIQKLRCRACYEALRFTPRIEAVGKLLVERMRSFGPYIALHLRYEKDILSFTGCTDGLSDIEADELKMIREKTEYWKDKDRDARDQRLKGLCPLTPKEVAIFLNALGYPSTTPIYIASGKIYGGDSHMTELRSLYPLLMNKEKLLSAEELQPFTKYWSQQAALDYYVAVESDVFMATYSGNMAKAVEGHRRYLGHRTTISPDKKALAHLFDKIERGKLKEGRVLSKQIQELHKKRRGAPRKRKGPISGTRGTERLRSEETFYANPLPDCLCQRQSRNLNTSFTIR